VEHHAFADKAAGLVNLHRSGRPNVVNCAEQRDPPADHLHVKPVVFSNAGGVDPVWWTLDSGVRPGEGVPDGASVEVSGGVPA
jgi:hypothetical protein